jgi:hypothetical protein
MTTPQTEQLIERLRQDGKRIEAQWVDFSTTCLPLGTPTEWRVRLRAVFFAGAVAGLDILFHQMDPGDDVTEADEVTLDALNAEIKAFQDEVNLRNAQSDARQ